MKLLLDTNILIDLVAKREPYVHSIHKLCIAKVFGDVQLWVSAQSYADAYYVLRKKASEANVKHALLSTLELFTPCGTYASDAQAALKSDWHDIEDYLIAHATKHISADAMITRDTEMIAKCPIKAMTPAEILRHLEKDKGLVYEDVEF